MDEQQQVTGAVDLLWQRYLADDEEAPARWELIFMSFVMIIMFAALITDRVAPDHVFVTALAFCMVTGIVDSKEGLGGFANEGVLTVMVRHAVVVPPCNTRLGVLLVATTTTNSFLLLTTNTPHPLPLCTLGAFCRSPRFNNDWCC